MRRILTAAVIGLSSLLNTAIAQTGSTIKGKISDNNGKALQSVTVSLLKSTDSSLVKADVTDANGAFEMVYGKEGKYLLSYIMIGFERTYSPVFEVKNGQGFDAGSITLQPAATKLQDVTVTSRKPMIEIKADKTVFNVENSINATGSNALELLQKSPGIQVDNNENISMKGKTGVRIYVDGK